MKASVVKLLVLVSILFSTNGFADDLRSLPAGTKMTSIVNYVLVANSECMVLTATQYQFGFGSTECANLLMQDSVDTCLIDYDSDVRERSFSGFLIRSPANTYGFIYPYFQNYNVSTAGMVVFNASNLAQTKNIQVGCRVAGGKGSMTFEAMKSILAPYFKMEIPEPVEF